MMKKTIKNNENYVIVSVRSSKAMEAKNDTVMMMEQTGADSQVWTFVDNGDGCWKIVSKATGKVMDVMLAGTQNGAQIHQWDDLGAENQLWLAEQQADGFF